MIRGWSDKLESGNRHQTKGASDKILTLINKNTLLAEPGSRLTGERFENSLLELGVEPELLGCRHRLTNRQQMVRTCLVELLNLKNSQNGKMNVYYLAGS